jgi:NTE family protein
VSLKLYIAATHVRTGKLRLVDTKELSVEALLASTRLPSWHSAVVIDGEAYGMVAIPAPAVFPLFYNCDSSDIVIILLSPLNRPDVPTSAAEIQHRAAELSFDITFPREMRSIAQAKEQVNRHFLALGRLERRLRRLNIHVTEADQLLAEQD